jgi:hypothetical protein
MDEDANNYHTVTIGNQTWMEENLRTTKYNDGNNISMRWDSVPAYSWYDNSKETFKDPYGALYNGFAVSTGNLCPTGGMLLLLMNGDHLKTILQSMTMDTRGSWMILQSHWLQKQDGIFLRLSILMAILFRCPREESVRILRIITVVGLMVLQQVLKILMGHFMTLGMMLIGGVLLVRLLYGTSIYKTVNIVEAAT